MQTLPALQNKIATSHPPNRALLIDYLKIISHQASLLPPRSRDNLAYEILRPFVEEDIRLEQDPDLYEVVFQLGSSLDLLTEEAIDKQPSDVAVSDRQLKDSIWQDFFAKVNSLEV